MGSLVIPASFPSLASQVLEEMNEQTVSAISQNGDASTFVEEDSKSQLLPVRKRKKRLMSNRSGFFSGCTPIKENVVEGK